jgi:cellulose biosynthesis protein BcsQ
MRIIAITHFDNDPKRCDEAITACKALAELKIKTLLIDLNSQDSATKKLGIEVGYIPTVSMLLCCNNIDFEKIIKKTEFESLDIIPMDNFLSKIEKNPSNKPLDPSVLKTNIGKLLECSEAVDDSDFYAYIIIECPSNLGFITASVLQAATDTVGFALSQTSATLITRNASHIEKILPFLEHRGNDAKS